MSVEHTFAIGLMSGTSGDGVDAALIEIVEGDPTATPAHLSQTTSGPPWLVSQVRPGFAVRMVAHFTEPYSTDFRRRLFTLFSPDTARVDEICRLNFLVAERFAAAALAVIRKAGLSPADVTVIGSHGQTIHHLPPETEQGEGGCPSTLQIGEPQVIAARTGILTVGNFRPADMALGGQGAPLVPYVDWLLLTAADRHRVVQNIGGIGNVTILPAGATLDKVSAFDTGPGNMVIDGLMERLTGQAADWDGVWAQRGRVCQGLLEELLRHPFLLKRPPKSTGREEFGSAFIDALLKKGQGAGLSTADLVATATAFTVQSIVTHWRQYAVGLEEAIVGGGGAANPFIMAELSKAMAPVPVRPVDHYGMPAGAKEALAFAVLGYETWRGRPSNVPNATGAQRPVVLGSLAKPV